MKKIFVSDVTLKVLDVIRDSSLLFREKTAIASLADSLGADAVEVAPIKKLREDTIIYKTIASSVSKAVVAIPTGFDKEGVKTAFEAIKEASRPRLQVELPVSTVQMEYTYHLKAEKMIDKIRELVAEAKTYCDDVEFSALDATRADKEFLIVAVKAAEESGASIISLADSTGVSLPEEIETLVKEVKAVTSLPLYIRLCDGLGMASASAIRAIAAGADGIKTSMSGDEISMKELSDILNLRGETLDATSSLDSTRIKRSIDDMMKTLSKNEGEDKEISEKNKLILDSDATLTDVKDASILLGYELSSEDIGKVHHALLQITEKKGAVGAKEFEALIAGFAMQAPSTYHLENYTSTCSSVTSSMSQMTLRRGDELLSGVSTGDGPIDSAFRAIEQCIGYHYELDDFQVQAITEGKEALGSALVRLRSNGKLYSGNGISTDIIAASIRAYLNALNKIVFEEK